jgi:MFS family permease
MMIEMASSDQRESTDAQLRTDDEPPSPPSPVSAAGRPPSPFDSSQGGKQQQQLGLLTTSAPHSSSVLSPTALFLYFLCLVYSFAVLGLDMSLLGPSLLELAVQTGTGIGAMSVVFFCRSGGILGGTLLAGQLVDRFPNKGNRLLCIALWALVASTLLFPFIPWVTLLAVTGILQGMAKGMVDNTAQLLLIAQYGERVDPYMQALHAGRTSHSAISAAPLSPGPLTCAPAL